MPSQQDIDRFSLAFHREAVERLRVNPSCIEAALAVLKRWQVQRGEQSSDVYLTRWEQLFNGSGGKLAQVVCSDTPEAATLRSMSPLGFLLSAQERQALRRETIASAFTEVL